MEVLKNFDAANAKVCVLCLTDMTATNKAIVELRKVNPNVPIVVRTKDAAHSKRLETMFGKSKSRTSTMQ